MFSEGGSLWWRSTHHSLEHDEETLPWTNTWQTLCTRGSSFTVQSTAATQCQTHKSHQYKKIHMQQLFCHSRDVNVRNTFVYNVTFKATWMSPHSLSLCIEKSMVTPKCCVFLCQASKLNSVSHGCLSI